VTLRVGVIAIVVMLASGFPASAQAARQPRDLWSEYPLEPVQTTPDAAAATMPFTPPAARVAPSVAAPGTSIVTPDERSSRWLWPAAVAAIGLGTLGFLSIRRRLLAWDAAMYSRIPASLESATRAFIVSLSNTAESVGIRHTPRELRRFSFTGGWVGAAGEPCVIHVVGHVQRRFVAEATRADQRRRRIATSRPFWRILGKERAAWNSLVDELERNGWRLVPDWGSQAGDPITGNGAWYEVHLVRHQSDIEATLEATENVSPRATSPTEPRARGRHTR
jgi:hypothetical protein